MSLTNLVDNPEYPNLFVPLMVGQWKYYVAVHYQSLDPDKITKSEVTELRWYKNLGNLEHEYIVATCHVGSGDVYLRLERRPADPDSLPQRALPQKVTETFTTEERNEFNADIASERKTINRSVLNTFQKSAPKAKDELMSADSVTRVGTPEGSCEEQVRLITRYQSFRKPFYLRDLAFLAWAVNEFKPQYQVFVNQCYWYARTLVNVAKAVYGPDTIIRGDGFQAAGTYTLRVTNRTIDVSRDHAAEVEEIKIIFQNSVGGHDAQVEERHKERNKKNEYYEQKIRELEAQVATTSFGDSG